jgi:glutamate synthase domain-containing protein 3
VENYDELTGKRLSRKRLKRVKSSGLEVKNGIATINAVDMHYRDLNFLIKSNINPNKEIHVHKVSGQRYIGTGLRDKVEIHIYGTPGNDLAAFMDGPTIYVHGNAQDGVGNTMNSGKVVVYGHAGDIAGYSMRGGKLFIRDEVGYRAGIHMKEYQNIKPFMVIGGSSRDFLGEYMAGGVILVLGLNLTEGERHKAKFVGTGMHSGIIYVCGEITHLGKEVKVMDIDESDVHLIRSLVNEFCGYFSFDFDEIMSRRFTKIVPVSTRPYGGLYAY